MLRTSYEVCRAGCSAQGVFAVMLALVIIGIPSLLPQRKVMPVFCDCLNEPFLSTWQQTVPTPINTLVCVLASFLFLQMSEMLCHQRADCPIRIRSRITAFVHGIFASVATAMSVTQFMKKLVGRPRPHFFQRCGWDVTKQECASTPEADAFKSFPSGHSSFSFATLGFVAIYLLGRVRPTRPFIMPISVCGREREVDPRDALVLAALSPLLLAAFIACSRIIDHAHHASDVAVGIGVGFFSALLFHSRYFFSPFDAGSLAGEPRPIEPCADEEPWTVPVDDPPESGESDDHTPPHRHFLHMSGPSSKPAGP